MHELTWQEKIGATPGRLALVGILSVILVMTCVIQFGDLRSETATVPENDTAATKERSQPKKLAQKPGLGAEMEKTTSPWPVMEVAHVRQHDPFRMAPPWHDATPANQITATEEGPDPAEEAAAAAKAARDRILKEIREQGVRWVVVSREEAVAAIGNREVRVGDVFGGLRVTQISLDGVTLVELESSTE